jgi:hypothetical protein
MCEPSVSTLALSADLEKAVVPPMNSELQSIADITLNNIAFLSTLEESNAGTGALRSLGCDRADAPEEEGGALDAQLDGPEPGVWRFEDTDMGGADLEENGRVGEENDLKLLALR